MLGLANPKKNEEIEEFPSGQVVFQAEFDSPTSPPQTTIIEIKNPTNSIALHN
jgi:hypothetical protein